jgi:hypothetical protein
MHKVTIIILASCILAILSCSKNADQEQPRTAKIEEKAPQADSTELPKKPSGTITGKVVDKSYDLPLPAASIEILETDMNTATDKEGNYTLKGIPPGVYNVIARFIAYYPDTAKGVKIAKDETTVVDFELEEYIPELKPHQTK